MSRIKEDVAKSLMASVIDGSLSPNVKKKYYDEGFSILILHPVIPLEVSVFPQKTIIEIVETEDKTIHLELSNDMAKQLIKDLSVKFVI